MNTSHIKNSFLISLLLIVFSLPSAFSQSKFEGKVVFSFKNDSGTKDMTYFVKNNMFRMEMNEEGHQGAMIFNSQKNQMLLLMPAQKMYMEFPMNMMKNYEGKTKQNNEKPNFKKTGETKEINGYKCEKWVFKNGDGESIAWMTKELGGFVFMSNPMAGGNQKPEWQKEIEAAGYFPMLVINKNSSGDEISRLEVKSIDKKKLNDSLFAVPEGFTKMDLPMMKK